MLDDALFRKFSLLITTLSTLNPIRVKKLTWKEKNFIKTVKKGKHNSLCNAYNTKRLKASLFSHFKPHLPFS